MEYRYYFNEDITAETINNLVEKLQAVEGKIELWFSTSGGDTSVMAFLISFLNSRKDDITVVLTNKIYSAGTHILIDFKGKTKIEDLEVVLFHIADRETYRFRKDSYITNQKILSKQDEEYNIKFAEKIKKRGLLTDKQLKNFLNGKDIVLYQDSFSKWKL
jgi:hypothetical protein